MSSSVTDIIQIDTQLVTPVYKQIVQSICRSIEAGVLKKDAMLPSVNSIAETFSLARGSVFTAYNDLRSSGIINSVPGKGYFVVSTATKQDKNIFLLFRSYDAYRECLLASLRNNLPASFSIDLYFYHNSMALFENLIREKAALYNTFIIMPEADKNTHGLLAKLDQKQLYLLDTGFKEYRKMYAGVYQNAEKDIYNLLRNAESRVSKYKRLFLLRSKDSKEKEIVSGFQKFTSSKKITAQVITSFETVAVQKGDGFIVLDDNSLVELVKTVQEKQWQPGKDIGILSYNETPLKSIIAGGISTFTTDFEAMGKAIANMVITGKGTLVENPALFTDRKSF